MCVSTIITDRKFIAKFPNFQLTSISKLFMTNFLLHLNGMHCSVVYLQIVESIKTNSMQLALTCLLFQNLLYPCFELFPYENKSRVNYCLKVEVSYRFIKLPKKGSIQSFSSPNASKYGSKNLRFWTLFMQCKEYSQ